MSIKTQLEMADQLLDHRTAQAVIVITVQAAHGRQFTVEAVLVFA